MRHTYKRTLALLLALAMLLSFSVVFVSAEDTDKLDVLEPVTLGTPLTTSVNCREYVVRNTYNGTDYFYFSAKESFYVLDETAYLAGSKDILVDMEASIIGTPRGLAADSKGNIYAVGDAHYLFIYDPSTQSSTEVHLVTDIGQSLTCWGVEVDAQDNVYIGVKGGIIKYDTSTDTFSDFYKTGNTDICRGLVYSDGHLYAQVSTSKAPSMVKKFDMDGNIVAENNNIPATALYYLTVVGDVVFGGYTTASANFVALDANTLEAVTIEGGVGMILGMPTPELNGKSYFVQSPASGQSALYEYDIATKKATALDFTDTNITFRCRNPFIQVDGDTCIITCTGGSVIPSIFNLSKKTTVKWGDFSASATEAKQIRQMIPGLPGSNEIYFGAYLSPTVAKYNIGTGAFTASVFSNGHSQSDSLIWYEGKLYVGAYSGAYLVEYDPATGTVTQLIPEGLKDTHDQVRIHALAAGDGKIFFSSIPGTGELGGCLGWYDLTTKELYVERNVVQDQTIISLIYADGYLYGTTSTSGGSSSTATQTEGKVLVYDVANKAKAGEYSVSSVTGSNQIRFVAGIAFDPNFATNGKIWGVVGQALFSCTFNKETKELAVKKEVSFTENHEYSNNGSMNWFPRPILFDDAGYMYAGFGSYGIYRIKVSDPTVNQKLVDAESRIYVLGEDGNLYYASGAELRMVALTAHDRVEQLIDAIGEVTIHSSEAIIAARKAYNALSAGDQALVSNYNTLTTAEVTFDNLSKQMRAQVSVAYDFYNTVAEPMEGTNDIDPALSIDAYAAAYAQGTINNYFIGADSYFDIPLMTSSDTWAGYKHYCKVGNWIALKLASPGAGSFHITLDYFRNVNNAKEVSFYLLPGDTTVEAIPDALKTAAAFGTADLQAGSGVQTADLGAFTFEAGKDYILIMAPTLNRRGKDLVDSTGETNARMHVIGVDMTAQVATLEDAQAMATTPFHSVKLLYDEAANAAKALIDAIGTVTLDSGNAIAEARAAYDALNDLQKPLVTNFAALTAAEETYAAMMALAVEVKTEYAFYNSVVDVPLGETIDPARNIDAYAAAYAQGTINNYFIGANSRADIPYIYNSGTWSGLRHYSKVGDWIAVKLASPGAGKFDIALNYYANVNNAKEVSFYLLPGTTAVDAIPAALESAVAFGTANVQAGSGVQTADLGSLTFEADTDYVLVMKVTQNRRGNTNVDSTSNTNARMHMIGLTASAKALPEGIDAEIAVVEARIAAIGEVSLNSAEAIKAARTAYDALTADQKAYVSKLPILTDAEAKYAELKAAADKAAADAVTAKIEAIGTVTLGSEEAIKAARADYEALTAEQKALVTNLSTLTDAEAKLAELKAAVAEKEAADKAAADAVTAEIEALGTVTLNSEEAIKAARAAYEALTAEQKALVTNLSALTDAEAKLAELKAAAEKEAADKAAADAVTAKIEAIGTVTLNSEETIKAARAAYEALTAEQKALVTNLSALTDAEAKLAELKAAAEKEAADKAAADAVTAKIAAIGKVTLKSEEAIKAARAAYEALTAEQKALVTNLDVLTAAEAALAALDNPKTGDMSLVILTGILVMSAVALAVLLTDTRKKFFVNR